MDVVAVGARLGSSAVAPLIRKLFVRDGPGAGLVDRPVRLSALVSFRGEKRTLTEKDLRKLATELVQRGLDALGPHDGAALAAQRDALAAELTGCLHRLGDLGHQRLAQRLREPGDGSSPHIEAFLTAVLDAACLHVLHFFTQRYAHYVTGRHGALTIFGLDLQRRCARRGQPGRTAFGPETARWSRGRRPTGHPLGGSRAGALRAQASLERLGPEPCVPAADSIGGVSGRADFSSPRKVNLRASPSPSTSTTTM